MIKNIKISKSNLTPSKKTFQQNGKWIEKENAKIIICACGNKYIKTRNLQISCVRCLAKLTR